MDMRTFDPRNLIVLAGQYRIEGFAETMLTIARLNPMWNQSTGATGATCRIKTNDSSCEVRINLQQCSPSNQILSDLAQFDESQQNGGIFPLSITYDQDGDAEVFEAQEIFKTENAYIEKMPDASFGATPQDWEWVIKTADSNYTLRHAVGLPVKAEITAEGEVGAASA